MVTNNPYTSPDGLVQKYGVLKTVPNLAGEYRTVGQMREVQLKINLADLTQSEAIQTYQTFMPAGARIAEVEVLTHTAAATGTAIDLGLVRTDGTTEIDFDGFLAAAPIAVMNSAGERTVYTAITTVPATQTGTGALIGTTLANVGYITCSMTDATAFTAGIIYVTIRYYVP